MLQQQLRNAQDLRAQNEAEKDTLRAQIASLQSLLQQVKLRHTRQGRSLVHYLMASLFATYREILGS